MDIKRVGFVCFGEVNTPYDKLEMKHDEALDTLSVLDIEIYDAGIVIDDDQYATAKAALQKLKQNEMDCLIVCIAGWIPTHAVIYVTDVFRHLPMLLWGVKGWYEDGHLVTTSGQAGTSGIRPAFEDMGYKFKYIYSVMDQPEPIQKISSFINAAYTVRRLRRARIGTMGYRDMLLYGTQFEGSSIASKLGVEVEPFEMLEMVQNLENLDETKVYKAVEYVKSNWKFQKECEDSVIEQGVRYALSIGRKIEKRGYKAISLIDVDGMKKLLNFPPAMVFMLLDHFYGVETIPENDIMGSITQLIVRLITGSTAAYMEYYEFFKNSMLIGVPDYVPKAVIEGDVKVLPVGFGKLPTSLLNVSKVKTGYVTCVRLIYRRGRYFMHIYTGEARRAAQWEECGWDKPAPQLPSLEVFPDSCTVEEFAQKVSSQHVILCYGNHTEELRDLCSMLDIEVI